MPDRPDLPAVATPWEDPLGNVWCAVPPTDATPRPTVVMIHRWGSNGWGGCCTRETFECHPALLAGLGRTLPEGPTILPETPPKRVAKVVLYEGWELAVKRDWLYERSAGIPWRRSNYWSIDREFITAAAEAFAGAGDVLPGEAE